MGSPEGAGWEEGRLQVRQGGVIVELGADQGAGCTRAHAHPCLYTGESTEEGAVEGEGQQSSGPEGGDSGRASSTRGEVPGGRPAARLCTASKRSSLPQTQGLFSAQTAPGFKPKLRQGKVAAWGCVANQGRRNP